MEDVSKPNAPLPKTGEAGSAADCSGGGEGVRGRVRGVKEEEEKETFAAQNWVSERWKAGSGAVMLQ